MAKKQTKRTTVKKVQQLEDKPFKLPPHNVRPEDDNDDAAGADGLTIRRQMFVEFITGQAFGNASLAAKMAGYSDSNQNVLVATASRLLTFVKVQQAIRERLAAARMTAAGVRNAIAAYGCSSMDVFLSVAPDGEPKMDWAKAAACGGLGHIKEYREEGFKAGDGPVEVVKRSFKIRDPMPALALMARMHGLVTDAPAATVNVSVTQMSEDDLVRIASTGSVRTTQAEAGAAVPDRLCERD